MALGWLLVTLAATQAAYAGGMSVAGPEDVVWSQSTQPMQITLQVENNGTSDLLAGWQLALQIAPGHDATGSVMFTSIATPPDDYVFGDTSLGVQANSFGSPSTVTGLLFDDTLPGVSVDSSGANLVQLTLSASPGTSGPFSIEMIPNSLIGAAWFNGDFSEYAFDNAPFDGGPVGVASVSVNPVPEPTTIVLLLAGGIGFSVAYGRRMARAFFSP
jgi:hypothetical protein